jgi:hypothetical protein
LKPQKTVFRPKEIKKQLALKGENISDSTLSRVNKSLVALGISQKTGKKRPRGRPIDRYDLFNLSGPDVMYGDSDLVKALQKIVSNGKIRNILYSSLIESKLLEKWLYYLSLFSIYCLKSKGASQIYTDIGPFNFTNKESIWKIYNEIKFLDNQHLKKKAEDLCLFLLETYSDKDMNLRYLFSFTSVLAGLIYPMSF